MELRRTKNKTKHNSLASYCILHPTHEMKELSMMFIQLALKEYKVWHHLGDK